jgi:hypothetical protein
MKLLRTILSLVSAFHLVIATSGVPLAYMFCGDNFTSWTFAHPANTEQKCEVPDECESTSCCEDMTDNKCHTELHIVQLSIDAVQAASHQVENISSPLIALVPNLSHSHSSAQIRILHASFLDKPPPHSFDRTIRFRSLLI